MRKLYAQCACRARARRSKCVCTCTCTKYVCVFSVQYVRGVGVASCVRLCVCV